MASVDATLLDFRRTVIQTGSEVILVGAERKKREIRLPGRYRESIWTESDLAEDINKNNSPDLLLDQGSPLLEPPDCSLLPGILFCIFCL
ncbi:hypothetical protein E2C01_055339 [Portunus trituberculatus]|uniref:Uncharacterized protein n=1 Tax=Portunus trituberculatus TaxID=210409 RepID=A0A5B7GM67_PORTR|nr:hypothetical protein [Portunus trituberculatus]